MSVGDKAEAFLDEIVAKKGGERRDPQVRLARGLAQFQESGRPLFAEAPTGSGKSFAAIAAARATGEQCLIATHTHALQQQLQNDAEMLAEATGEFTVSVLKGRSSYLCKMKEKEFRETTRENHSYDSLPETTKDILDWAEEETLTGDKGELPFPVSNETWREFSVSSEECIGSKCPFYRECFAEQAKERAKKADITILNHALVAQGMRAEKFLDGAFPNIILDECHEFPNVVSEAYGATITKSRLLWLARSARRYAPDASTKAVSIIDTFQKLVTGHREPIRHLNGTRLQRGAKALLTAFEELSAGAGRGEGGEKDYALQQSLYSLVTDLEKFCEGDTNFDTAWIEPGTDTFTLKSALYNTGSTIKSDLIKQYHSTIFMSATIRVGESFQSTAYRMGLKTDEYTGATIPHLFDYENKGAIWLPDRLKNPNDPEFARQVGLISKAVIEKAEGRTLVLCSSWANVKTIGSLLTEALGDKYPILVQEPGVNVRSVADRFRAEENSVLVGTRTLWTGISFEGDTCLCVVIDKMPFPSTASNPVIAARQEHADDQGLSGFALVSLPEAVLTIVQGVGRMIRTVNDKGVVVICDPRLNETSDQYKPYGKRVLRSLPNMPVLYSTRDALRKIEQFRPKI